MIEEKKPELTPEQKKAQDVAKKVESLGKTLGLMRETVDKPKVYEAMKPYLKAEIDELLKI